MHVLIIDAGFGGLSVFAEVERRLGLHSPGPAVRLTFVNATPGPRLLYNSMGSTEKKLSSFDRFLNAVTKTYCPDIIFVACNTLAVLFPETSFAADGRVPVTGIVDTGVEHLYLEMKRCDPSTAVIFGTATTIEQQTYPQWLNRKGIHSQRIVSQACPGLAQTIARDRGGRQAQSEIEHFVSSALAQSTPHSGDYLAFLGCTHYGYRSSLFEQAFEKHGVTARVLNPNDWMVDSIMEIVNSRSSMAQAEAAPLEIISRFRVPQQILETVAGFVGAKSPRTAQTLAGYTLEPTLF